MNNSVVSTIEKIKLQEQGNEAKLKEKREYEATVSSLQRAIKETIQYVDRINQEQEQLEKKVDALRYEVLLARTRRDALVAQTDACTKELQELTTTSNQGILKVWELRSSLCNAVQEVADNCDVRALLIRPIQPELIPASVKKTFTVDESQVTENENRLKATLDRKKKLTTERDRLMAEPEMGEEFVRKCFRVSRLNRKFSSKVEPNENEPIRFSTSPAAKKTTVSVIRKPVTINMPWYQPYSVVGSVAVFLIYFCYLREENDVDLEFNKTLYQRIKGLEKEQLIQSYKFNKEHGKSVEAIEQRLNELEAQESTAVA